MANIVRRSDSAYWKPPLIERREAYAGVASQSGSDARAVFTRLKRRIPLAVFVMLLVAIPAGIATYLATPLYKSSALIQVNPDTVQILPYRDVAESAISPYYEPYMATQDQVLRGQSLAKRVSTRLATETGNAALSAEAGYISKRFGVRRVPNSQLFEISYLAPSPDAAAAVVNIFAEEYIKQQLELRRATREKARESLQRELEGLERRVQASETELASYAKRKNMIAAGPDHGDLVQSRLAGLDQQVATAEADVIVARTRLEALEKASTRDFPERLVTPVISTLTAQLLAQEQELTNLRARFGENWPAVIAKRGEVSLLQQQLTREKTASLAQTREQSQLDLRAAQGRYAAATNSLNLQKDLVGRYNNALIQYNILRREVETSQKLYEGVLERLRQTSVQGGLAFGNVQVLEPGLPVDRVESPKIAWNLSIASLLGLALGLGLAFAWDFWDNSIATHQDLEELTRLPALGTMPAARILSSARKPVQKLVAGAAAQRLGIEGGAAKSSPPLPPEVAESIRAVCASILLSQSDRELRVIVVTSAVPAEGKTTVVCALGRALAESGAETLVVETDLRAPALSQAFGLKEDQDGLSLFLSGHTSSPRMQKTDLAKLSVVSAGPRCPNPVALLNSERMATFLTEAAASFRFVLLDSPPVLAVADARILAAHADGVILVVRARQTSRSLVKQAQSVLQNSGFNTLGTILNGASDPHSQYYKRYYGRS